MTPHRSKAIAEPVAARARSTSSPSSEDAGLIVVGSTHTGRAGRVMPGSTAERLLHGSPCPVAVAPKDYAHRTLGEPGIIGCGYDGTPAADGALDVAHRLAAATGARLRVIRAFHPVATVPQRGRRRWAACRVQRHAAGPGRGRARRGCRRSSTATLAASRSSRSATPAEILTEASERPRPARGRLPRLRSAARRAGRRRRRPGRARGRLPGDRAAA